MTALRAGGARGSTSRASDLRPHDPVAPALQYVHLTMPGGREAEARMVYCGALGFAECGPANPASRRGLWLRRGALRLHLGGAPEWPARTAPLVLQVGDLRSAVARLCVAGCQVPPGGEEGSARTAVLDPFGNRIELVEAIGRHSPEAAHSRKSRAALPADE